MRWEVGVRKKTERRSADFLAAQDAQADAQARVFYVVLKGAQRQPLRREFGAHARVDAAVAGRVDGRVRAPGGVPPLGHVPLPATGGSNELCAVQHPRHPRANEGVKCEDTVRLSVSGTLAWRAGARAARPALARTPMPIHQAKAPQAPCVLCKARLILETSRHAVATPLSRPFSLRLEAG